VKINSDPSLPTHPACCETRVQLPTQFGLFQLVTFAHLPEPSEHVALCYGNITSNQPVLVRLHSECLTGDVFTSLRCDCREQLENAMKAVVEAGSGIILYLRQEGRGIGLYAKMKTYALQEQQGLDTVEANQHLGYPVDARNYAAAAAMLKALGATQIRLLSNNPDKVKQLQAGGIVVTEVLPHCVKPNPHNRFYLATKAEKLGHSILIK
jgi:3,4-dihydroxy 2-butanone 4-phosphate synthase/GTP cyclohydrolase II